MGANFQDLYKNGTAGWSVRYYKSKILTAFIEDLGNQEQDGIPDEVCKMVYKALNASVTLTDDILEGTFLNDDLNENLIEFRDAYENWNGVKVPKGRQVLHGKLKRKRKRILRLYQEKMDKTKKKDKSEWDKQHTLLSEADREIMDELTLTFSEVVSIHGKSYFKNLAKAYLEFENAKTK